MPTQDLMRQVNDMWRLMIPEKWPHRPFHPVVRTTLYPLATKIALGVILPHRPRVYHANLLDLAIPKPGTCPDSIAQELASNHSYIDYYSFTALLKEWRLD